MFVKADLHIHSCLSPCASLEMSPRAIIESAVEKGLNLIALTDHNAPFNLPAFAQIAGDHDDIAVFYGLEVTTLEEVHVLAIFDDQNQAFEFGSRIYGSLPKVKNNPEKMGDQVYVDRDENIIGSAEFYLGTAADISFDALLKSVHQVGGLFIPAHIDRPSFSLMSQLGYIPEGPFDALEFSRYHYINALPAPERALLYPNITNSDAHYPADIGRSVTVYDMEDLSIVSLKKALFEKKFSVEVN